MKLTSWGIVLAFLLPPWLTLGTICYWYFLDNEAPMTIEYSSPLFLSQPAENREEAEKYTIKTAKAGDYVWTYREICVAEDEVQGILKQRWDSGTHNGFSWSMPEIKFASEKGCRKASYAIQTPALNFTREVIYNSVREYQVNPLKTIIVRAAGIPLTIVFP